MQIYSSLEFYSSCIQTSIPSWTCNTDRLLDSAVCVFYGWLFMRLGLDNQGICSSCSSTRPATKKLPYANYSTPTTSSQLLSRQSDNVRCRFRSMCPHPKFSSKASWFLFVFFQTELSVLNAFRIPVRLQLNCILLALSTLGLDWLIDLLIDWFQSTQYACWLQARAYCCTWWKFILYFPVQRSSWTSSSSIASGFNGQTIKCGKFEMKLKRLFR